MRRVCRAWRRWHDWRGGAWRVSCRWERRGGVTQEVLSHCRGVLVFERDEEAVDVRRAAAFLLASVAEMELSGKEAEETETLLRMAARDSDNIVRGHAETALQTLASRRPVVEVC